MRQKIIAGNWKMNKNNEEAQSIIQDILEKIKNSSKDINIIVAPSFTCLSDVYKIIKNSNIKLSAQNMYFETSGAFTGQISADMLKSVGCEYVILGHSECRTIFLENDTLINKKVKKALDSNIKPILCIGETLEEREKGITNDIVNSQVKKCYEGINEENAKNIILAYEPVWAIGTGKTATPEDANEVHKTIRENLKNMYNEHISQSTIILYGGSMNESNAHDLLSMPDIDGGLIGGASLDANKFVSIINCL